MVVPKKTKNESMEKRLRRLGDQLDDLIVEARKIQDYARKININELLRQKARVERQLKALPGPMEGAWGSIQEGLKTIWGNVKRIFKRAKGKPGR